MARFDVYRNPGGSGYLLDVQAEVLGHLDTRVVIPLIPSKEAPKPAERLNPTLSVGGDRVILATQFLAAVPTAILKEPVTTLDHHHDEIVDAIDFLMQGF